MAEYLKRETILDDLDRDAKVLNKKKRLAKENHCHEDYMIYYTACKHLLGFRNYITDLPAAYVVDKEKINGAVEEIHLCEHENGEMFDKGMMHALGIFMKHIEEI